PPAARCAPCWRSRPAGRASWASCRGTGCCTGSSPVDDAGATAPPEGFEPVVSKGGFMIHNGPFYERVRTDGVVERCFWATPSHTNGFGLVHGGMMATFMDGLLAQAVVRGAGARAVTVNLSLDYLRMARAGEWVMGEARLLR